MFPSLLRKTVKLLMHTQGSVVLSLGQDPRSHESRIGNSQAACLKVIYLPPRSPLSTCSSSVDLERQTGSEPKIRTRAMSDISMLPDRVMPCSCQDNCYRRVSTNALHASAQQAMRYDYN
jgi:hypothetical protein